MGRRVAQILLVPLVLLGVGCQAARHDVARAPAPDVADATAPDRDDAPVADMGGDLRPNAAAGIDPAPPSSDVVTPVTPPPVADRPPGPEERGAWTIAPYQGFGAWLDAFDWSATFARSPDHVIGLEAIDAMAAEGVQTLYIQTSRWNSPTDVLEPERLGAIIDRAHANGMAVVAWYLPTLVDPAADLRRILASAALDVDGLGIDIEATDVDDPVERSRRMVALSAALRDALPGKVLGGIVLEPVLMEDVNADFWPGYPWAEMAPFYDVWLPMGYWTNRRGEWRDAGRYTGTNIDRIRERLGDPDALIHAIGGIGDETTVADLDGMVRAATERGVIGGSIYDYRTTDPAHWATLRAFVRP